MGMFRLTLGDDFHDRLEQRLALKFRSSEAIRRLGDGFSRPKREVGHGFAIFVEDAFPDLVVVRRVLTMR